MKILFYINILSIGLFYSCRYSDTRHISSVNDPDRNTRDQIIFRDHLGRSHLVDQSLSENVSNVSLAIADITGFPLRNFQITKSGKILNNDKTLEEQGINSHDVLELIVALKGGMVDIGPNPETNGSVKKPG